MLKKHAATAPPPLHLLLGTDPLRRARDKLDAVIEEMNRWEQGQRKAVPQGGSMSIEAVSLAMT
jgi:hypothetical protein